MVSGVCPRAARPPETIISNSAMRASCLTIHIERPMEVCLFFTGLKPCDEHKYSFVP